MSQQQVQKEPPSATPSARTMMVAIDGSRLSECALNCALKLRKHNEKLILYHVYDSTKPEKLLSNYHGPDFLVTELVSKLIAAKIKSFQIITEDRGNNDNNRSTSEMILDKCREQQAAVLVGKSHTIYNIYIYTILYIDVHHTYSINVSPFFFCFPFLYISLHSQLVSLDAKDRPCGDKVVTQTTRLKKRTTLLL